MSQVLVRNLDEDIKQRLKKRAAEHGHSMEAELRLILSNVLKERRGSTLGLGSKIVKRFNKIRLDEPLPELHDQTINPMDI